VCVLCVCGAGFALVKFASAEVAADAIQRLNGLEIDGRGIQVGTTRPTSQEVPSAFRNPSLRLCLCGGYFRSQVRFDRQQVDEAAPAGGTFTWWRFSSWRGPLAD
jgi:hypothetical protein